MTQQDKFNRHKELCDELHQTYIDKNTAYGDSFGKTFKDLGVMSAITRISDKYNRIVSLTRGAENNIKDESILDTLCDLGNYCLMTVIELENNANNKNNISTMDAIIENR